jgi:hypothetical protein
VIRLRFDVVAREPGPLIRWYSDNVRFGPAYYRSRNVTVGARDQVEFGDLAWAVLLAGQPRGGAALSLLTAAEQHDEVLDLESVPERPLHELDAGERDRVVDAVAGLAQLRGFRSALASKTIHPKRRHSVPVLDNTAIFGSLAKSSWRLGDSVAARATRDRRAILTGLDRIHAAVADAESQTGWAELERIWTPLTRIELFDICWWAVLHGCRDGVDIAAPEA